jgi:hypothetical protein
MSYDLTLVWTAVRASDPLLLWFRGVVRETAQAVLGNNS